MKSVTETAKIFGVSRQTILNWIEGNKIKATRIVGTYRIEEEEIERLKRGE
jgi:excisionase family DNA binding protein